MQKITPCLWFNGQAEEAVHFYISVFKNSKITAITHYGEAEANVSGMPDGSVLTIVFELDGQEFMALNGGPQFKFTEAISLIVNCESQDEMDELWAKFSEGGEELQCGWIKDKYGLTWQIVPTILAELLNSSDPAKSQRVMKALLQMRKLDLQALKQAAKQQQ